MSRCRLLGVSRALRFSPGMSGADRAIFEAVAGELSAAGCEVTVCPEESLTALPPGVSGVFSMARSQPALRILASAGVPVVNSVSGVAACERPVMTRLLETGGIPQPRWWVGCPDRLAGPQRDLLLQDGAGCWLKRADRPVSEAGDVVYVPDRVRLDEVLHDWSRREVGTLVANSHLPGDLIKFYGVAGTPFFYWFYPSDRGHSKFGLEAVNGTPHRYPVDGVSLQALCSRAASLLGVTVYGGDCILSADGVPRIIDFNDWPSFSPCRAEASGHIAQAVLQASGLSGH